METFWDGFWAAVPHAWPNASFLGFLVGWFCVMLVVIVLVMLTSLAVMCGTYLAYIIRDWFRGPEPVKIKSVLIGQTVLKVILTDGTIFLHPYEVWSFLHKATSRQLCNCRLIEDGTVIEWPDLDERMSLEDLRNGPDPNFPRRSAVFQEE